LPELIAAQRTHSDSKIWSVITWTNGSYDSTIFLTRVYSRALMQFPRYPAGLSRSFNSNGFFQISAKDIDWTGIAGRGKTNRVTLIICTEFRKPEGISNSDARGRRYVRPMRDMQKEKNISKVANDVEEICFILVKCQSYF